MTRRISLRRASFGVPAVGCADESIARNRIEGQTKLNFNTPVRKLFGGARDVYGGKVAPIASSACIMAIRAGVREKAMGDLHHFVADVVFEIAGRAPSRYSNVVGTCP